MVLEATQLIEAPSVHKESLKTKTWEFLRENKSLSTGLFILSIIILMAVFADFIAPYGYAERSNDCGSSYSGCKYSPPSAKHWFGTTRLGMDVFSRVIYGSRTALQMAFAASLLSLAIGIPLGILAAYYGGPVDRVLTLIADSIYSFPSLLIAITLAVYLSTIGTLKTILAVSVATAIVYIPTYFKVVRAQVLQVKEEAYVEAARSMGASDLTIILRYVTPNVIAAPIALIPFNMTDAILTNAGLAFLGLGIEFPTADWGYDVFAAKSLATIQNYPWLIAFPAFMIFLLSFSLSLIGDALNDKFNPLISKKLANK